MAHTIDEHGNRRVFTGLNTPVLIFYPDHDERYKHMPDWARVDYPDEILIDEHYNKPIKREKAEREITPEYAAEQAGIYFRNHRVPPYIFWEELLAKDVPYKEGFLYL